MSEVIIVDYDCGNLFSIARALDRFDAIYKVTNDPDIIRKASKVILPGVGAYSIGMKHLQKQNLDQALEEFVSSGNPLMGICLGMQLLVESSDEFGQHNGLGFILGKTTLLAPSEKVKVPHIGWNSLLIPETQQQESWNNSVLKDISMGRDFYFVHSHCVKTNNPQDTISETVYGGVYFASVIKKDNVMGCQFHPEKSGEIGLKLVKNFLDL